MSKRKIDNTLLYGILTALVLLCAVALGFSEWGHNLPEAQARDYESSPYAESANRRINSTCVGMSGVSLAECIIEIEQSERSNYRAEQDLHAQRYMMVWAFFMTLVSFLTAGIAAAGLYWIRATLIETREAVRAADDAVAVTRDLGQAQVRAYITIESCTVVFDTEKSNLGFRIQVKNSGNSPARGIQVEFTFDLRKIDSHGVRGIETVTSQDIPAQSEETIGKMFHEKKDTDVLFAYFNIGKVFITMNPVVSGVDVFGKPVYADRVFGLEATIGPEIDGAKMISLDNLKIHNQQV